MLQKKVKTTAADQQTTSTLDEAGLHTSLWARLMAFSKKQEASHLLWMAIILVAQCCILTPGLAAVTLLTGPHFYLFMTALVVMMFALVSSLAFAPTSFIIPVFALSLLMDLIIVIYCLLPYLF